MREQIPPRFRCPYVKTRFDIPLSFFMTAAGLVLAKAFDLKNRNLFLLSGVMGGFSAWTKNEGVMFCALAALIVTGCLFVFKNDLDRKTRKAFLLAFLFGLTIPLFTAFYLKLFLGGPGIYLSSARGISDYGALLLDHTRTTFIALCFFVFASDRAQWIYLWPLFLLALLYSLAFQFAKRGGRHFYRWIPAAFVILTELGYFLIFQITPLEIKTHIQWSMTRLLLHTGALALAFAFQIFSVPWFKSRENELNS